MHLINFCTIHVNKDKLKRPINKIKCPKATPELGKAAGDGACKHVSFAKVSQHDR